MPILVKISAKSFFRCAGCSESVRKDEKHLQVMTQGNNVRGERYCLHCEHLARENNVIVEEEPDLEREAERERETFAAYLLSGNVDAYWTDKDAGLV